MPYNQGLKMLMTSMALLGLTCDLFKSSVSSHNLFGLSAKQVVLGNLLYRTESAVLLPITGKPDLKRDLSSNVIPLNTGNNVLTSKKADNSLQNCFICRRMHYHDSEKSSLKKQSIKGAIKSSSHNSGVPGYAIQSRTPSKPGATPASPPPVAELVVSRQYHRCRRRPTPPSPQTSGGHLPNLVLQKRQPEQQQQQPVPANQAPLPDQPPPVPLQIGGEEKPGACSDIYPQKKVIKTKKKHRRVLVELSHKVPKQQQQCSNATGNGSWGKWAPALVLLVFLREVHMKPFGPDQLKEDHSVNIRIDGNSQQQVDGSYNLDLVRKDGTRQQIASSGPTVQGIYEYTDERGEKKRVNYEASREGGFRILNPDQAQGLREFPADPSGPLSVTLSQSHIAALEFHKSTVEKAWREQEMHSRGAAALKDKFGGGHINASLHREKDPKSNAVKSVFRKEFRDSQGRLRGFQQAHSVVHAVNTSAVNGSMPFLLPPGGRHLDENGFNIGNIMDKIREFHQSLFGAGAGGDGGGGPMFGGMGADGNGTGVIGMGGNRKPSDFPLMNPNVADPHMMPMLP
ncbi:unnamed protein product [Notodromas monacha]|uniref:Uncharacterized protein n=1 Tax=Notodromas monacha TaxID=399045 RepID=A0A7R9BUL7_9CRUS|nr:unnamed protein product [Notodromas monacha]CAG0921049.1 unnamed protein product [Notodromas monacha]